MMSIRQKPVRAAILAAALASATVLSACKEEGDAAGDTTTTAPAAETAPATDAPATDAPAADAPATDAPAPTQ